MLPRGDGPALSPIAAVPEPAAMRLADPEGVAKPVLKKPMGTTLLVKRRAYIADDEGVLYLVFASYP